ncbi:MAG: helix-turn-helix transcriptional regulator [Balneolaceae bacterium]
MERLKSSERRMKLILMLQESKKKLTADELADIFGVSRRTIFRDLNVLSEINVPVTWDEYSGYGIMPGYKIPPLMFSTKELATIVVGLNFVKSQVDKELADDAKGVEIKIRNVLPEKLREFMRSIENRTIVDPFMHFGTDKKRGGGWYLITSAISQHKTIQFDYISKTDDKITKRIVDPLILVFYKDHWNLIGFSHKRESIRNFILDRMSDLAILDQTFTEKEDFNAEALIFRSEERSHLVIVDIEGEVVSRFKANLPTKIIKISKINPNLFKIEFKFDNLEYLNEWLMQFADKIKIIHPHTLKSMRKKLLHKMMN